MEFIQKLAVKPKIKLSLLDPGACFIADDIEGVFMVCRPRIYSDKASAISFNNGTIYSYPFDKKVTLVSAELHYQIDAAQEQLAQEAEDFEDPAPESASVQYSRFLESTNNIVFGGSEKKMPSGKPQKKSRTRGLGRILK